MRKEVPANSKSVSEETPEEIERESKREYAGLVEGLYVGGFFAEKSPIKLFLDPRVAPFLGELKQEFDEIISAGPSAAEIAKYNPDLLKKAIREIAKLRQRVADTGRKISSGSAIGKIRKDVLQRMVDTAKGVDRYRGSPWGEYIDERWREINEGSTEEKIAIDKESEPLLVEYRGLKEKFDEWFQQDREQVDLPQDEIVRFKELHKKLKEIPGQFGYFGDAATPWEDRDEKEELRLRQARDTIGWITKARQARKQKQEDREQKRKEGASDRY